MSRKLCRLAALIACTVAISHFGATRAGACTQTCSRECVTYVTYCSSHPGGNYTGCNFVRFCGSNPSANLCNIQECIE